MSQNRQEQEDNQSDEKCHQELEAAEKELEANADITDFSLLEGPQTSTAEQTLKPESWLWGWFPFPLLSGLTWLGDRNKPIQEPVCCQIQRKKTSSNMCPACEIMFCKKCETLHYSRVFIEHGLLGHSTESLPEALSPAVSTEFCRNCIGLGIQKPPASQHSTYGDNPLGEDIPSGTIWMF